MTKILKTPQAEADLDKIWLHIAQDNPVNADKFLDKFLETCNLVATQPMIGLERGEIIPKLRSFPVASYMFFYFQIYDGIEIVRVFHSARDIKNVFH